MADDKVNILSQGIGDEKSRMAVRQLERVLQSALVRISDLEVDGTGGGVTLPIAMTDVTGLAAALAAKAAVSHTHAVSDVEPGVDGQIVTTVGGVATWADAVIGSVGGTGTTNKVPKWTASTTLGDSSITDTGSLVTIAASLTTTGDIIGGATTVTNPANINELARNGSNNLCVSAFGSGAEAQILMLSGGGTKTSPAPPSIGNSLGLWSFTGVSDSSNIFGGALIRGKTTENWSNPDHLGAKLEFSTTTNGLGSAGRAVRLTIDHDGTSTFTGSLVGVDASFSGAVSLGNGAADAHVLTGTLAANGVAGSAGDVLTITGGVPKWAPTPIYTGSTAGLVPTGTGTTTRYLREDGTWDVPPGSGGGGATLADGDYGDVVVSGSGAVMTLDPAVWTARVFSGASVHNNASSTAVSSGVSTAIVHTTEEFDTDAYHSNVTNTTRLTAPRAGYYRINGSLRFFADNNGVRRLSIRLNGVTEYGRVQVSPSTSPATEVFVHTTAIIHMSAGDYVELVAFQNCGASLNCYTSQLAPFQIEFIGT